MFIFDVILKGFHVILLSTVSYRIHKTAHLQTEFFTFSVSSGTPPQPPQAPDSESGTPPKAQNKD